MKRLTPLLVALVSLTSGLVLSASSALACGGFFCSAVQLEPVEQNAERILFEIEDGVITATVEIKYSGEPEGFAWVVPTRASDGDELNLQVEVPGDVLSLLDDATAPSIIPPPTECSSANRGLMAPGMFAESAMSDDDDDGSAPVDVEDLPQVGPYEPQLVSSDDPDALVAWLNDNDYLITPEMEPFVADYVAQGMKFLAMKLAPGSEVADVAPISMSYEGDSPSIPIVLTGVAAEPEMGVMAFIAADVRYESANFVNLEVATEDVSMNPGNGFNNYYSLISWKADQAGGNAAFTQWVDSADTAASTAINRWSNWVDWNTGEPQYEEEVAWLEEFRGRHSTLSRLYTRLSGWEMVLDPSFSASSGETVSGVHDLSDRPSVDICSGNSSSMRSPCGDTYCGEGAVCATTDAGIDGCVCPAGSVARTIQEPDVVSGVLSDTVTCQLESHDMMASLADLDVPFGDGDPCASATCGESGTCVALNGFPTCACDDGYAAVALEQGSPTCVAVVSTYPPEALVWTVQDCSGCSSADAEGRSGLLVLLVMAAGVLGRRRRNG